MANFTPSDLHNSFLDDPVLQDAEAVEYFDILVPGTGFHERINDLCAAISNLSPDIKDDKISFDYIKDVFLVYDLFEQQVCRNKKEKEYLIKSQSDYIGANLTLIAYMTGDPKVSRDAAFSALRKATWALIKIGNLTPTDASSNLLHAANTARARASKKAVDRLKRARVKEELRNMMLKKAIANSDKSAMRIQPDLQEALGETAKGDYPSISLIRNLLRELVAER